MDTTLLILLILGIIAVILWIYVFLDLLKGSFSGSGSKIMWLVVVLIFPIVGALAYLLIGKK